MTSFRRSEQNSSAPILRRSLTLPLLTLYGLGTIVGGGFYALIGKVSLHAGMYTPFAFMTAALVALFSAFSFAELSARFPKSAGEALYVREAFRREHLSAAVGWMVIATGVVSAATLSTAIAGFLQDLTGLPPTVSIVTMVLILGGIAAWGIMESVISAIIITVIEIGGLLFVLFVAREHLADLPQRLPEILPPLSLDVWEGILLGGFLSFYSFIGFEDMVNVAEEVKNPRRNLPIAILLSLLLTAIIYFLVTMAAVLSVPLEPLGTSHTPLAEVVASWGPGTQKTIGVISILAGVNGALVQIIMASRVAFGMAEAGQAPRGLSAIHPATRTPLPSTGVMTAVVLILALWFPLVTLAKATSSIILIIFTLVNLSLVAIKRRTPEPPEGAPRYPLILPVIGGLTSAGFLIFHLAMGIF
ncbi:MAG: amino acid permease [Nitrospinaceae bacterium]|nr:amino acid permease [Nitrospinaceae bacterium]NIR55414.1 amino acid permease [Nitrospinaceae bacterium]NIS85854.1 amino acid permease [Nitrospinaceae bacterium]NIT82698.1 amino acid permease [Nitrospinaceae bacterium]NIU45907.1 amino acid permease [Nitrospinaceae bacterium]